MFLRIEFKVFLIAFILSWTISFLAFILYLPLAEQFLELPTISVSYVLNFFYGISLYCILTSALSVLLYIFVKPLRNGVKVFAFTFFALFFGLLGYMGTYSLYRGNPGNPLWMILIWQTWWVQFAFTIFSLYFFVISAIAVIIYEVTAFVWRRTAKKVKKEKEPISQSQADTS